MKKEELERFVNKTIAIGTPHSHKPNGLFFYYGKLSKLGDETLTLETRDGDMLITYDRVLQLKDISASGGSYVNRA